MASPKFHFLLFLLVAFMLSGCFRYSFTGVAIPADVRTIYIPTFSDQSASGIGDLSSELNDALVNRFVNQSRLRLTSSREDADVYIDGTITNYQNRPFSVGGQQEAELNRITLTVRASFQYRTEDRPKWDKNFSGTSEYDPSVNPVDGEVSAAFEALTQIADNMFNDALGDW